MSNVFRVTLRNRLYAYVFNRCMSLRLIRDDQHGTLLFSYKAIGGNIKKIAQQQ